MITRIHWQSPQLFGWMALLFVASVLSIVFFYRPQVRAIPWPGAVSLMVLRGAAIGALALSILRPSLIRPATHEDRDVLAILVDHSKSMSVIDQGLSKADLVRLATALNALPPGTRSSSLADLRQLLGDLIPLANDISLIRSELEYARLAGRGVESAESRLRDAQAALNAAIKSASATSPAVLQERISKINFDNAAEEVTVLLNRIDSLQSEMDQRLYDSSEQIRSICDELSTLSRAACVQRALEGEHGLLATLAKDRQIRLFEFAASASSMGTESLTKDFNGSRTDLAGSLREVRRAIPLQPISEMIVFSDGRQAGVQSPALVAPINDIPVLMIPTGAAIAKDLAIFRANLPASASVGQAIVADLDIAAIGMTGANVEVSAEFGGRRQSRVVALAAELTHVEIPVEVTQPGPQEISLSIAPVAGEVTFQNNTIRRVVQASGQKIKVALIGGALTRDFQQLRSSLRRAAEFTMTDELVDASHPCDIAPEKLATQDVVVFCDVPTSALSQKQWEAVVNAVNADGCGVFILASDPLVIAAYAARPTTNLLLPWQSTEAPPTWRNWPGEEPQLRAVPAVPDLYDAFELVGDPERNQQRWNQLPPIQRFIAMPRLKAGVRALIVDRDSGMPILTEARIGAGRVLTLGTGEVWRWREAQPQQDRDRIWSQFLRYVQRLTYAANDSALSLNVDQRPADYGSQIRVRGKANRALVPGDAPLMLQFIQETQVVRELQIDYTVDAGNQFEQIFSDIPPGQYYVRLYCGEHSVSIPLKVAENDEAEMRDVSVDLKTLQRLAGAKGEILMFDQIQSLPQRIAKLRSTEPRFIELTLWDSAYLYLFVVGCFGLEWAMRKRIGLA